MKRFLSLGLAALMTLGIVTGCTSASAADGSSMVRFDFERDDSGFTPIFADYPNTEGVEDFYEFRHEHGKIPIDGAGNGLFISGNNHSDDLFMGYVKALEGFVPGRTYRFDLSFQLATDVEDGLFGVGGSPGEGVTVKCGITPTQPAAELRESGSFEYYRMNIDTGRQANGGKDMAAVGDMAKVKNERPGEYEFKKFEAQFEAAANIRGEVWLIIATDSGFEAVTSYYLDDISVAWSDVEQPAVSRSRAAQMLFQTADRPSADPSKCPFVDVDPADETAEAITWAFENGYLSGYGDRRFGPEDSMTVEQAMAMIYRFFGSPQADQSVLASLEGSEKISPWAKDAVAWTVANEVMKPAASISPKDPITVEELTYSTGQIVVGG